MHDLHGEPETAVDREGERRTTASTPRWVWAMGAVLGATTLILVVVMLLPGGGHGPGRHTGDSTNPLLAAGSNEASRTVDITALDTMSFEPSTIRVSPGELITFVVTNRGDAEHEFVVGDATAQHHVSGAHAGSPSSVVVKAGETKSITWRFEEPGIVEYACRLPGHYEAGMRGLITVS